MSKKEQKKDRILKEKLVKLYRRNAEKATSSRENWIRAADELQFQLDIEALK